MVTCRYTFAHVGDGYMLQTCSWNDPFAPFLELLIDIESGQSICQELQRAYDNEQDLIITWQLYTICLQHDVIWMWAPSWYTLDGCELNVALDVKIFFALLDGLSPWLADSVQPLTMELHDSGNFAIEAFDVVHL